MVINDKVVFIPIPKNASWSMEHTCVEYGFDLKYPSKIWENYLKLEDKSTEKHLQIYRIGTPRELNCIFFELFSNPKVNLVPTPTVLTMLMF